MHAGCNQDRRLAVQLETDAMKTLLLTFLVTCLFGADDAPRPKADLKDLQGTWRVVSLRVGDEEVLELSKKEVAELDIRYTFIGGLLRKTGNFQNFEGTDPGYTIEVGDRAEANTFDQKYNGNSSKYLGIYKFEDKKLVICSPIDPGVKDRPQKFTGDAGSCNSLTILERVK
jgi:uncharacterized protein (TIGR03067 family)